MKSIGELVIDLDAELLIKNIICIYKVVIGRNKKMKIFDAYIEFISFALDKRSSIALHELSNEVEYSYNRERITFDEMITLKLCIERSLDAISTERVRKMMREDIRK